MFDILRMTGTIVGTRSCDQGVYLYNTYDIMLLQTDVTMFPSPLSYKLDNLKLKVLFLDGQKADDFCTARKRTKVIKSSN